MSDETVSAEQVTIALDAMSGDLGAGTAVAAAVAAVRSHADIKMILVGDESVLAPMVKPVLKKSSAADGSSIADRLEVHHASEVVTMEESAAQAIRMKKDSSMRVAVNLVHNGTADACVSCGNTGALMGTAKFVLKTLPGIDRPAIVTTMPNVRVGKVQMLDLGANVDCTAEQLYQFAIMGSALAKVVGSVSVPRVGLLNIGSEEIKGNELVKEADKLLQQADINYIGFVEGDQVYLGDVDVVVTDGFVGNVALKSTEGVAKLITGFLKQEFARTPLTKLMALCARPVLKRLRDRIDPRRYNGASLLGLKGLVIKSHGSADVVGIENAIGVARLEARKDLVSLIEATTKKSLQSHSDNFNDEGKDKGNGNASDGGNTSGISTEKTTSRVD